MNGADARWPQRGERVAVANGIVRLYEPRDREAIRSICRETAYRNRGFQVAFEDGEVFADYWTRYYTDWEPQTCLVHEQDGVVCGYLTGCLDTRRFQRFMLWRIGPPLGLQVGLAALLRRYRNPASYRMIRWTLKRAGGEAVSVPLDLYPAHYHCNFRRSAHGAGLYTRLTMMFLDHLEREGVPGLHGMIDEPAGQGPWLRMVKAVGGRPAFFAETESSFAAEVLEAGDRRHVNRAWGDTVQRYRLFVNTAAERFRL